MRLVVVYIYWCPNKAKEFIQTYRQFQAGLDHRLIVICNDGRADILKRQAFDGIPHLMLEGDNIGYDIGAFQQVSEAMPCDLMVYFGSSSYLRGPGWLSRMAEAYSKHGPGLYGTMGHTGVGAIAPHIRTTCFWMEPRIMNQYPYRCARPQDRYPFEHGPQCLTSFVSHLGLNIMVVNWHGEYRWPQWNVPNGYHSGRQTELIAGDRLSRPPFYPYA